MRDMFQGVTVPVDVCKLCIQVTMIEGMSISIT